MQRTGIVILCLMIALLTGGVLGIVGAVESESEMCIPMGSFPIAAPDSVDPMRPAVSFPHAVHFNYSCKECHHKWDNEATIQGCMTSGCHDLTESPEKPVKHLQYTSESIKYYKFAFHKQCVGCHRELKQQNKEETEALKLNDKETRLSATGPTGCKSCHDVEE
jgi:hypothetical protein